jgi:hypothetical protein
VRPRKFNSAGCGYSTPSAGKYKNGICVDPLLSIRQCLCGYSVERGAGAVGM